MPSGKTSYMNLADYTTGGVETLAVTGNVKFSVRPPAAVPKWLLIATDAGELRVFSSAGVLQPSSSVDLGWNPDQVSINNQDPPRILVRRASTSGLYCYRSGALEWSQAPISTLVEGVISDGYVVDILCTAAVNATIQFRKLVDGTVEQSYVYLTSGITSGAGGLCVAESGLTAFACAWLSNSSLYLARLNYAGTQWIIVYNGSVAGGVIASGHKSMCAANGSLMIYKGYLRTNGGANYCVTIRNGADGSSIYSIKTLGGNVTTVSMNPSGARSAYVYGSSLNKLTAAGALTTVALDAGRAANDQCVDVSDDPYFLVVLINGNIVVYDDTLTKRATVSYALSDGPVAAVRSI